MSKDHIIPRSLTVQIEIQRQVVLYSTSLSGDIDSCTSSTLLNIFNNELDAIFTMHKDLWSPELEIQLLGAKLYLFSLCLSVSSDRRGHIGQFGGLPNLDSARLTVQLGLPSAVSLIHNVSKLNNESRADSNQLGEDSALLHYPKYYFRLVMFAVVFLIRFLSANSKSAQEDRELAISHITIAHQFFSSFPSSPEISRVAEVIEALVRGLKDDGADTLPPVRTRLGASLMYNTLDSFQLEPDSDSNDPTIPLGLTSESWKTKPGTGVTMSRDLTESSSLSWPSTDLYNDLADSHFGIQRGRGGFQEGLPWMGDEMLLELFGL